MKFLLRQWLSVFSWRGRVRVIAPKFVAPTVRFNLVADGFGLGGKITIAAGARISEYVVLSPFGGEIQIGTNVYIGSHSTLFGHGKGLKIGSNVLIANHVTIVPASHRFSDVERPICTQTSMSRGIIIMDDVWIGAGARILDGVILGTGCVVGAGSVVNKSVPDYAIVAGVPAKQVGARNHVQARHKR